MAYGALWGEWAVRSGGLQESELMGLPRDVSSGATCVGFTAAHHCALPIPTILRHTPTMHRGVKADVHRGRWEAWLASPSWGNVPPSPLPCSWSHRTYLGGFMGPYTHHPYIVWVTHQMYGAEWSNRKGQSRRATWRDRIRTFPDRSRRVGGGPDPAAVSSDTVQAPPIFRLIALTHSRYSES